VNKVLLLAVVAGAIVSVAILGWLGLIALILAGGAIYLWLQGGDSDTFDVSSAWGKFRDKCLGVLEGK
jgi:hypothetical protein